MPHHHCGLSTVVLHQDALLKTTCPVRTPIRFLGIVGLQHVRPLHVHGDDEVSGRIGIRLPGLSKLDVARHVDLIQVRHTILKVEGALSRHKLSCPLFPPLTVIIVQVKAQPKFWNERAFENCECPSILYQAGRF